jgi:hypothetical protein
VTDAVSEINQRFNFAASLLNCSTMDADPYAIDRTTQSWPINPGVVRDMGGSLDVHGDISHREPSGISMTTFVAET